MKVKRVLLVFPPGKVNPGFKIERTAPPLGLAYLAAMIENDFETRILDCIIDDFDNRFKRDSESGCFNYGRDYSFIKKAISDFSPDIVGVSCLFTEERLNAHFVCKMTKEINPDTITIMGGMHPSVMPLEVMKDPNVDYAVIGEAEDTFRELLLCINKDRRTDEIDGLAWRDGSEIKINPKKHFIKNLDKIPFPSRHKIPLLKYSEFAEKGIRYPARGRPYTTILSSRGCPAKCIFCSSQIVYGPKLRMRSAENVLLEIDQLVSKWKIRELDFFDDNLTYDRERSIALFKGIIERRYNLWWSAGNGLAIYALDDELLELMKQSGCYRLHLAVESASQNTLNKIIRKPLDLKKVPLILNKARQLNMETVGFFIIGFPGETMTEIKNTVKFAEESGFDYVTFQIASPHPGTRLFDLCRKNNLFTEEFSLDNLSTSKGNIVTKEFSPVELERIRVLEWDRINFSTEYRRRKICAMMGINEKELESRRRETKRRIRKTE